MLQDAIDLQFAEPQQVNTYQEKEMQKTLRYVNEHSPYYKKAFKGSRVDVAFINTLEDLQNIPVTTKQDLQKYNMDFLCVPVNDIIDYVTTSGTLGDPVTFALTNRDLDRLATSEALSYTFFGCKQGEVVQQMATNDRRFMAGLACTLGGFKLGVGMIRVGNGIPELQWDTILRMKPTVCVCVPSFMIKLAEFARAHGIDYHCCSLKKAFCVGESIRNNNLTMNILGKKLQAIWPELQLYCNYASTEMQSSFMECECMCGAHHKPNLTIVEFLDENNRRVKENEQGEITITTLGVEGMPMVRFKTGDICYHFTEKCGCGRTSLRLGPIIGRLGQMIKYKGTTLYPSSLYDVLDNISEVKNYIVEVYTNTIGTDGIRILVGTTVPSDQTTKQIKDIFRSKIRVAPEIVYEPIELIAQKQMPSMSRKLIKFFDYRNQNTH
ncbi:MAG: AMP-binding protein [Parabacteroides sp.]